MSTPTDRPVQTRDESGELRYFSTLKEARNYANSTSTVWKISFAAETGERVRLIRCRDNNWQHEPLL